MAQTANHRFRFNLYDIALREQLRLTEKQRLQALNYFESEWRQHAYIDVLPTTIFVPKEVAERKLGIKRSVIIAGIDPEYIHVYDAPRFRSRKFVKKPECDDSYFKPFVNVTKDDLKVVTVFNTAPQIPVDFAHRDCFVCQTRHSERKGRLTFALTCDHSACRDCWRTHCEFYLVRGMSPIPCVYGDCSEKLTIGRATTLLCDEALNMMIAYEWRDTLRLKDTLRCAGCRHWMQRTNFFSKARNAICTCGCYTCLFCGKLDHTPLRCKDAAEWSRIRGIESEDEAAVEAENVWSLTRENFEDCLGPSKEIASEQFRKNLRFMKTNDRKHGKMLEKSMPMVARLLELRLAQQFANRKEMQARSDDVSGEERNRRWSALEKSFTLALDTLEETRNKAKRLENCRRHIFSYYELYNL